MATKEQIEHYRSMLEQSVYDSLMDAEEKYQRLEALKNVGDETKEDKRDG